MRPDLREQILYSLGGRVCFIGLGNVDSGDDGFGVRLAEALVRAGVPDVLIGATAPEPLAGRCARSGFDHLVFLDAVDFGAAPGSVVFLNSGEMAARFPQVSTHNLSLGMLAKCVESAGQTRAGLLGAQPQSLKRGLALSPALQSTLSILAELISNASFLSGRARTPCATPPAGDSPPCLAEARLTHTLSGGFEI